MAPHKFRQILLICLAVISQPSCAEVFQGIVTAVKDADTLVVLTLEKKQVTIRLDSIDGLEKRMSYGSVAKKALSDGLQKDGHG